MISQIIKAAQINPLQCQWSLKWKMLLRIYKALLLTLFDPFKYLLSVECSDDALLAKHQTANKGVAAERSIRCLAGHFQTDVCPFFIVAGCKGDCEPRKTCEQGCLLGFSREFSSDFGTSCASFHSSLMSLLYSCLATAPLGWFTVMTGGTLSGSEATARCLSRVTTGVTVIYRACFIQVDERYYNHYNAWKCLLHVHKLFFIY